MRQVNTIKSLRQQINHWRLQGQRIALVPTMGNLHGGHLKLVDEASKKADKVVVSIFINPTQFGVGEDFASYPRTEQEDIKKLQQARADLLFLPTVSEIYTSGATTLVSVAGLSTLHCGASRPGHFDGVATVVTKLFNIVQPDLSLFGNKDFQQLLLIKTLVRELNLPIEIVGVATEREDDGLAMSSRNGYLSANQRLTAPHLYRSLCNAKADVVAQKLDLPAIGQQQSTQLTQLGFAVDYFTICRSQDLQTATTNDTALVIMAAVKLGNTRLIDALCFSV